jgi:hypothetical protein
MVYTFLRSNLDLAFHFKEYSGDFYNRRIRLVDLYLFTQRRVGGGGRVGEVKPLRRLEGQYQGGSKIPT